MDGVRANILMYVHMYIKAIFPSDGAASVVTVAWILKYCFPVHLIMVKSNICIGVMVCC
jgi:hypothetical protein